MPALTNEKHEKFAQLVAGGMTHTEAYLAVPGYKAKDNRAASSSGKRLLNNKQIAARIEELRSRPGHSVEERLNAELGHVIDPLVRGHLGRIQILEKRRAEILKVIAERAVHPTTQNVPGGKTGLVAVGFKTIGKRREKTYQVDVPTLKLLNDIEQRIAMELGQWGESAGVGRGEAGAGAPVAYVWMRDDGKKPDEAGEQQPGAGLPN